MTAELESDFALKNGAIVHIRPIRPEDEGALIDISRHLSPQTVYQRFFSALPELPPEMAHHLANVNYTDRMALIAEAAGQPIAVGRYEPTGDPGQVELALVVLDEWQNRGLGRILLREIVRAAVANGIRRFRADVLADNHPMLRLLASELVIVDRQIQAGIVSLVLTAR